MRKKKVATEEVQEGATMSLTELKNMSMSVLMELAEKYEIENASSMRKQELIFAMLQACASRSGAIYGEGCWKSCLTATVFCVPHCRAICPARTIFMFPLSDSALLSAQG